MTHSGGGDPEEEKVNPPATPDEGVTVESEVISDDDFDVGGEIEEDEEVEGDGEEEDDSDHAA